MKEKNLKIIIALMSIAVIGLIAVQIYWIVSLVNTEERKFISEVSDALEVVVDDLEKNEAAEYTIKKFFGDENIVIKVDENKTQTGTRVSVIDSSGILEDQEEKKLDFEFQVKNYSDDREESEIKSWVLNREGFISVVGEEGKRIVLKEHIDSIFVRKTELVEDVVNQLIIAGIDTSRTRFNIASIDSLLNNQLVQRGISAEYFFGIRKSSPDSFIFIQDEAPKSSLEKSSFSVRLFSDRLFHEPNFLTLYFPNQRSYILKSLSVMLSISALLILVIVGVFFKTVQLLVKQKKITDVKNDLINNITHEFKTPISTISLACEALEEPRFMSDDKSVSKFTNLIREENNRLSYMVETILNNAAVEKGDYKLSIEKINIHELIGELADKYRNGIAERGGDIKTHLNSEVYNINSDKFHFTNIVNNLLDNAAKYTTDKPEIVISTESHSEMVAISIEDNGIGISNKDQKRIFDTFFRVHKGNIHDVKGYGIGLSYVKKMVNELGGSIEVRSKLNSGSRFTIKFPQGNYEN